MYARKMYNVESLCLLLKDKYFKKKLSSLMNYTLSNELQEREKTST